jgi:hypothetical protein
MDRGRMTQSGFVSEWSENRNDMFWEVILLDKKQLDSDEELVSKTSTEPTSYKLDSDNFE